MNEIILRPEANVLFNQEAEEAVVSSALINLSFIDKVDFLSPRNFADSALGQLWGMLVCMRETQESQPDFKSIVREIRDAGIYDRLGGIQGLTRLAKREPNPGHIIYYAKKVREASHRRRMTELAKQLAFRASDPGQETMETAEWAAATIEMYAADPVENTMDIAEACDVAINRAIEAQASKKSLGVKCGIRKLDVATSGMFRSELITVAARTGIGKTAFATQIGYGVACQNLPVLQISLEMDQWELAIRVLAAETGIDVQNIKAANLNEADINALRSAKESIVGVPYHIWRSHDASIKQIRAKARLFKATKGLALLIIDYIGLIKPENGRLPRHEQISRIMKQLKTLAGELEVPVMALCQIGRDAEGKEPHVGNLRESGSVEEDSNSVWLLHRKDRESDQAKVIIGKSRNGRAGYIELGYNCALTQFFDPDESRDFEP